MSTWPAKLRVLFFTGPLIMLATAAMGLVSLLVSLFDASGRGQHRLARAWSRLLLKIAGVRVETEGLEKLAPGGSYVFVADRRSYFDVPCILAHVPAQIRFLTSKKLFNVPLVGYHLRRSGHLPVSGDSTRASLRSLSAAARAIQERQVSVLVFPEGGRTEGELGPFGDGAAYIAIRAGVPVVPIALLGTRAILPLGSAVVRAGTVRMRIGDPAPTLELSLQDRTRLSQSVREALLECYRPQLD